MGVRKQEKSSRTCAVRKTGRRKIRVMKLLTDAVKKMEAKFKAADFKPTIGDFLKLVQMEKEIGQEMAREIKVTWVETPAESEPEK